MRGPRDNPSSRISHDTRADRSLATRHFTAPSRTISLPSLQTVVISLCTLQFLRRLWATRSHQTETNRTMPAHVADGTERCTASGPKASVRVKRRIGNADLDRNRMAHGGAASAASFYAPISKVKKWTWETTWAVTGSSPGSCCRLVSAFISCLLDFGAFYSSLDSVRSPAHVPLRRHVGRG